MRFEWDVAKAAANLRKHGVSFEAAETAFADPLARLYPDQTPGTSEDRLVLLGQSSLRHLLVVVHVERSRAIRIISAWKASKRERRIYEEDR
jgi:uncharacterized DUF497 family protein